MLLATFKHISSKNADYYAAEAYLTFEHDEFTMKPTLDENGRFIPRKDYRISTLNCRDEDFAIACLRANLRYGKNQKREDVKSHHYIISFDPKDVPDHGLTVDLAQSLGEKFCKEHFPGHQAIVCTHPDGHNGSGNVHVHIVINSLRIEEVPFMPYMDRSCDTRPGMKHRCTNAAMEYFRSEVMEMCHDAGLYQIDLLNGSKTRVTEREYWAKKKGQLALDEENAVLAEQGLPVKQTKFETDKDKLREEIRMALSDAVSFEDFAEKLLRRGITVKESRGRLSYLTPDRTKPITARKLGDDFDKAAVFAIFVRNTKRVRAKTDTIHSAPAMQKIINERDTVSRMVDIDAAKEKGKGYEHWAKKHNLKNASRAYLLYKEMGFDSPEALATACDAAHEKLSDIRTEMKSVEATIAEKKELRNHVLNYHKTRYVIDEMKACKNEKARQKYRDEHDSDFIIVDDEAAAVVRHIFAWCMEGFGPSQIAKKLKEAKVDCPTVHWMKMGRNAPAKTPDNPYDWAPRTITGILEKMEYLGHMVNFKTRKQSYRSKKKLENPQDQWKIFENTHEAIIDEETFARVQELRKNKRRPARTGKTNMFSGLVRCADCGEKLYYCTSNSFETRQDHFVCSTSRKKGKEVCDTHFIRAVVLEEGTLQHMRLVIQCVADYEDAFRRALGAKRSEEAKKDLSAKKRTLQKSENRLAELDRLFKRIYEDMVNGKLSETRFQMLADDYEQEQADLRAKIEMLENEIQNQEDQAENVDRFIRQAKKYLYLEKLTPTILNDMVNAVYVHAPDKSSGHRVQDVTISYNYIGILPANLLYDVMNGKAA